MGYLDGSTITVDAILTKNGRQILSQGGALNVSAFTLSDTGVDYTLCNIDHASGSAFYGEAIENLPQVEALPAAQYQLRNKLVTFGRDTVAMPFAYLNVYTHPFTNPQPLDIVANITGFAGNQGGFHLLIPNVGIATCSNVNSTPISGNALMFINEADIPNAQLYELITPNISGTGGYNFVIDPQGQLDNTTTMTLTFIHIATGAWTSALITVNANVGGVRSKTVSGTSKG